MAGPLFFASSSDISGQFDYAADPDRIVIDLDGSPVWDASTVAALDAVVAKYASLGKTAEVVNVHDRSAALLESLSGRLGAG